MIETYEKDRIIAGILAIFAGSWGIHRFYLGRIDGIFYLMFSFTFVPFLVSMIDALVLFTMPDEKFKEKYANSGTIIKSIGDRIKLDREAREIMDNIPQMKKDLEFYNAQYPDRTIDPNKNKVVYPTGNPADAPASFKRKGLDKNEYMNQGTRKTDVNQNRVKNRDYISNDEYLKNQNLINKEKFSPNSTSHEHIKGDPALTATIRKAQKEMADAKATQYYIDSPKQVDIQAKLKELKELKKSGFISKEDYEEEVRKLTSMF